MGRGRNNRDNEEEEFVKRKMFFFKNRAPMVDLLTVMRLDLNEFFDGSKNVYTIELFTMLGPMTIEYLTEEAREEDYRNCLEYIKEELSERVEFVNTPVLKMPKQKVEDVQQDAIEDEFFEYEGSED